MKFQITEEAKEVWKKADYIDKYNSISDRYITENTLEKPDKDKVIVILKNIGYSDTKYDRKENFYSVEDKKSSKIESYINISLKYGVLEIISGIKVISNDIYIPTTPNLVFRLLGKREELPKKPTFSNYDELERLLKETLDLYESLKAETLKLNI